MKFFRSHRLAAEIAAVLGVKVILIVLASVFLFGGGQRPRIDPGAQERHLFGPQG
ncbi:MAG: hypothetical protein AB7H77_05200 [Bdellovibrionales bacterium]